MSRIDTERAVRVDKLFAGCAVVPVVRIAAAGPAVALASTLVEGGLRAIEITLRTPAALAAIERIAAAVPEAVVGAGTVLTGDDLSRVAAAGARFAIAPGCTDSLYQAAAEAPIPLIPGVATASEIMHGLEQGHGRFKFFPAEAAGGVAMLRAWAGPFADVRFMPTGGVTVDSAGDYLSLASVIAVGGSWMVPDAAIEAGDWDRIGRLARAAAALRSG